MGDDPALTVGLDAALASVMGKVRRAFEGGADRVTLVDGDEREIGWLDADGRSHFSWLPDD